MSNSQYIVKEKDPKIIFEYDSQSDLKTLSKFSETLKELDIPPRKWHNPQGWVYEQVKIWVLFRKNNPVSFSFDGTEKNTFSYPYYASRHIHQDNKDDLDRNRCYEVKPSDIKILDKFFKSALTIKGVGLYNIWFRKFPSTICAQPNIEGFNFHSCRIDKFPDNFKDLSNLKTIHMKFSWIKMPNSFANCKNLRKINFEEACLIDKFPDDIGKCLKLQELIYAEAYMDIPAKMRYKIGITSLPPSIGKIPNLTKMKLTGCVNLRSLPEELAYFPLKNIWLDNCMIKKDISLLKSLANHVNITWYNLARLFFENVGKIKFDFDLIIDHYAPFYEYLQSNVFEVLIWNFPEKKIQIIRILEQWAEKTSNQDKRKLFQDFISKISPKFEFSQKEILFL